MRLISLTWLTILFSANFLLLYSCEEKPEKPEQQAEIQDYTALDGDKELARINSLLES